MISVSGMRRQPEKVHHNHDMLGNPSPDQDDKQDKVDQNLATCGLEKNYSKNIILFECNFKKMNKCISLKGSFVFIWTLSSHLEKIC